MRSLIALLIVVSPAFAQPPSEPLVVQVKNAIDRGVNYLRSKQQFDGSWESSVLATAPHGGQTTLSVLALLNCGVPVSDSAVQKGLNYIRRLQANEIHTWETYIRSLMVLVFAEANLPEDKKLLRDNVKWLVDTRVMRDGKLLGWNYYYEPRSATTDASNSQYAVLALWSAKQAGEEVSDEVWKSIRQYYRDTQDPKLGGWEYSPQSSSSPSRGSTLTMTTAGVCGLLIAAMELPTEREAFASAGGPATNCGLYADGKAIALGFHWINDNFKIVQKGSSFYNLYGLERAGRLSGQRFIGQYDWYREGCKYLVQKQVRDGCWLGTEQFERWPVVNTGLALLFLSKGRTPVLISKVVHGRWPRADDDFNWNNDRNDLRHLVANASKELFKKQPLAWQTVDMMKAALSPRGDILPNELELQGLTSDLLQSPILYITGHQAPRFTAIEKDLLKRYVDNGGFILAEACCASAKFDAGFKELVAELWPDQELTPLGTEHPVWQSPHFVAPGQPYHLHGLNQGCKTVLIYSPQDLSCQWESNKPDDPRCIQAFRLGLNIIAYATGMQPPQPRLFQPAVVSNKADLPNIPRGTLKVAQLKHGGDWQPAPRAMRNLMEHVHRFAGLDVALKTEIRSIHDEELVNFKFVYMHGRSAFAFDAADLKSLRFNFENGGLLFADACCGSEAFDKSFRAFARTLFPGAKLEPVPLDDILYSHELGGEALTAKSIRYRTKSGQAYQLGPPVLDGIRHDGRWAVLYSRYDIGCALENNPSTDCRGYDSASAQKLARAAVLYTLRP
jgi:hypothetical protein